MSEQKEILKKLEYIEKLLTEQKVKPMNVQEACAYLGISRSRLYHLSASREVRAFKPGGKILYFLKADLDDWVLRNPLKTKKEINDEADEYILKARKYGT